MEGGGYGGGDGGQGVCHLLEIALPQLHGVLGLYQPEDLALLRFHLELVRREPLGRGRHARLCGTERRLNLTSRGVRVLLPQTHAHALALVVTGGATACLIIK